MSSAHPDAESGSTRLLESTGLRWTEANQYFLARDPRVCVLKKCEATAKIPAIKRPVVCVIDAEVMSRE